MARKVDHRPDGRPPDLLGRASLRERVSAMLRKDPAHEDYLRLLADDDLWALMQIRFSTELAEFTEQLGPAGAAAPDVEPHPPAPKGPEAPVSSKDQTVIREAMARALDTEPSRLADSDYERVTRLDLSYSPIESLDEVARLKNLETLKLTECKKLGSAEPLNQLTNLQSLDLRGTPINSAEPLKQLTNLQYLGLRGTQVSKAAIAELRETLPRVQIMT